MSGFSSTQGRVAVVIASMLCVGTVASCGGAVAPATGGGEGQAGRAEEPTPAPAGAPEPTDARSETTADATAVERTGTGDGGEVAVMRDGVWRVGDAGEVEFRFENGALSLIDVRANPGWPVEVDEQDADEIEVEFGRDDVEWDFDVEVGDGNVLRVEIAQRIDNAEAGVYRIGDAGEVEFGLGDGGLTLVEARPSEGWDARVGKGSGDEVETDLVRGNVQWQFEAELDDGEVEVEIRQRISGPVAN